MNKRLTAVILSLMLMLAACATPRSVGNIDTPLHHANNGYMFLDRGMFPEAEREFHASLALDPQYGPALAGMAVIRAHQSHDKLALHLMKQALTYAATPKNQALIYAAAIRMYTELKSKGWVDAALDSFNRSTRLNPDSMDAYYFMGLAYKESYNFKDAERMFDQALKEPGPYRRNALLQVRLVRTIAEYPPQTMVGKKASLLDRVNRAEAAAILVEELGLEKLIAIPETPAPDIKDIEDQPYRRSIEIVARAGIKGLEPDSKGYFHPDEPVSRAELAVMAETIIIRATGLNDLSALLADRSSPFYDVRKSSPYYNAALLAVTWGIMDPNPSDDREFDPLGTVSGADVLRVVYKLRDRIAAIVAEPPKKI
jgi:tetratricopeptide (TPR) repeat protein